MHVTVTGATGNLGTALMRRAPSAVPDLRLTGLSRREPRPTTTGPQVRWEPFDVRSDAHPDRFTGTDALVHLAWRFQPTRDPVATWESNVRGTIAVYEAAAAAGVRTVVHLSSVGAYAPRRTGAQTVDESWPTHALPTAAYGREKSYLERYLDAFERRHPRVRVVRLRPAFVFQWAAASEQRRLFAGPFLPHRLVRPGAVPVLPHVRDLPFQVVHADDVADATIEALRRDVHGAFNLAADPPLSTRDIARALEARTFAMSSRTLRRLVAVLWHGRVVPASPGLIALVSSLPLLDTTRARDELGWTPRYDAATTLRHHLRAIAEAGEAGTPPLQRRAGGRGRWRELTSGVGRRDPVDEALRSHGHRDGGPAAR